MESHSEPRPGPSPSTGPEGPWLGVDFGERSIGLAISDPGLTLALPLATIERDTDRRAVGRIAELAAERRVTRLVIGDPAAPIDPSGDQTSRARRFGEKLARRCRLPCLFLDETLTTREAEHRLDEIGLPSSERAKTVDQVAAQLILEEALARHDRSRSA